MSNDHNDLSVALDFHLALRKRGIVPTEREWAMLTDRFEKEMATLRRENIRNEALLNPLHLVK